MTSIPNCAAQNNSMADSIVSTDVLIVGTGPSGGSLASFLASHGITGIIIGMTSTTADTPRAHITNMAAMECLRDIELDRECAKVASPHDSMLHVRVAHSMAGEEFGRMYSWGNDPAHVGDYEAASPAKPADPPQTLLEPILIRYATSHGFQCRFDTEFISFKDDIEAGRVEVQVKDRITGIPYQIHCRYLIGADGARSKIASQLALPMNQKPGQGVAYNVLVKADMSHLIKNRKGNLHWIMQPDKNHPKWAWITVVRMVKPWYEWMFVIFPDRKAAHEDHNPTNDQWLQRVREFIGDDSIPAEIIGVSKWRINEAIAEHYSKGNVFCLGDTVHRHPPMNGLGSNTCIQDAFNLGWKIAYVLKGLASPSLLASVSRERQPVGQGVVTRANDGFREYRPLWTILGILEDDLDTRKNIWNEFSEASPEGRQRRMDFQNAFRRMRYEVQGLGIEMNQRYTDSEAAVYVEDEEFKTAPAFQRDPILYYEATTYPGCRLPHAWLNTLIPSERISTIDITGKGRFTILTGIGGRQAWSDAASRTSSELGVPIAVYSIGRRQDLEDVYMDWSRLREVDEDGAILVRPDRFVAWRSRNIPVNHEAKLLEVMRKILCL